MAKATREYLLEYLEAANMVEVSELIKDIEENPVLQKSSNINLGQF